MEQNFADIDTSRMLKELGFNEPCIASYRQMQYPINDSGNDYNKSLCLTIDCEMPNDEQKVIWIEKENAHFHWHEGNYDNGEHSRCELEGEDCKAPLWQQVEEWLWDINRQWMRVEYGNGIFFAMHTLETFSSPIATKIESIKGIIKYMYATRHLK